MRNQVGEYNILDENPKPMFVICWKFRQYWVRSTRTRDPSLSEEMEHERDGSISADGRVQIKPGPMLSAHPSPSPHTTVSKNRIDGTT